MLISISGSSGAGKTEIGRTLANRIPNGTFVSFDDHEDRVHFPDSYPASMPGEYDLADLAQYMADEKKSCSYPIFFDYPFGRANGTMSEIIDSAVFLRVPLDVSMARRTRRELCSRKPTEYAWLISELENWDKGARDFYRKWEKAVETTCDLTVDALGTPDSVATLIINALNL